MNYFSDTLTISLVLVLLFGSIALYLYTRIQQSEQKVSLLESILLDLKMSNEIKEYVELPASEFDTSYASYDDNEKEIVKDNLTASSASSESTVPNASAVSEVEYESLPEDTLVEDTLEPTLVDEVDALENPLEDSMLDSKVNYDTMHLKDLQTLAKSRGITGISKKGPLIEALKTSDKAVKPGSNGTGPSSFLETSASFSNDSL
jgi:hypothetical protein